MPSLAIKLRDTARILYKDAKKYCDDGGYDNLLLCTLKLRMCLESLSYEKIVPFDKKLDLSELKVWQPRQLIKFLSRDLEPLTNQNYTLEIFKKEPNGENSEEPVFSGKCRVLTFKEISKYYDKLGSFLHSPTIAQIESDSITTLDKMVSTCRELLLIIEEVLDSTVWSAQPFNTHSCKCHRCNKPVVCYVPLGKLPKQLEVTCNACKLEIAVSVGEDGKSIFEPILSYGDCLCGKKLSMFRSDFKEGTTVECDECHTKFEFSMKAHVVK